MTTAPFTPLAGLLTPETLKLQRQADLNTQYLRDQSYATGQERGFASLGTTIGAGLSLLADKYGGGDTPSKVADRNKAVLDNAYAQTSGITDPLEKQAAVLKVSADNLRGLGAYDSAAMLDASLVQITEKRQELRKLSAETANSEYDATKKGIVLPYAEAEAQAKLASEQAAAGKTIQETQQGKTLGQNYINPKDPTQQVLALASDTAKVQELISKGFIEFGKPTVQAAKSGDLSFSKPEQALLEKNFVDTQTQLDGLHNIASAYKPEYSSIPNQGVNWATGMLDKVGLADKVMTPAQVANFQQYQGWRRDSASALNNYIHRITGAQMSATEAVRIQKGFPNPEADGTLAYQQKFRNTVRELLQINRRSASMLHAGSVLYGDQWDIAPPDPITDNELDGIMKAWGIPTTTNPGASADGKPDPRGTRVMVDGQEVFVGPPRKVK